MNIYTSTEDVVLSSLMLLLRINKIERELHISRQKYLEIKNPVFQMRENRETPLL
jgi:hypothetical protein